MLGGGGVGWGGGGGGAPESCTFLSPFSPHFTPYPLHALLPTLPSQDLGESDLQLELLLNQTKSQYHWEQLAGWTMACMVGTGVGIMAFL